MPVTKAPSPDDLLTIAELANDFRISQPRLRKLVRDGRVRHLVVGLNKKILVPRWAMVEWIHEEASTAPTPLLK